MAVFRVVKQSPKSKFILKRNFDFWIPHLLKTIIKYMLCSILYNPTDCSLPGSSVHGILQARILERVAYPSSNWSSWTRNRTRVSCIADRLFTNWVIREDPSYSRGSSQSRNWTHIFLRLLHWQVDSLSLHRLGSPIRYIGLVQFSRSVVSDSLQHHGLQHTGFLVLHQVLELAQNHVPQVGDAIQPSHPLSSPSPPAFTLCQHQGLFQGVSSSHQVAKVLEFQVQHPSFQYIRYICKPYIHV